MRIRKAVSADYEPVMALLRQLNLEDPVVEEERGREIFGRILTSPDLILFVAETNATLVGTCYLNIIPNLTRNAQPYAVIENVVTDVAARGQGIGQALIQHAVDHAFQAGCYKVMLMTGRKDPAVHRFYQRCGFDGDSKHAYIQRPTSQARLHMERS